jgi:hypothetical protein
MDPGLVPTDGAPGLIRAVDAHGPHPSRSDRAPVRISEFELKPLEDLRLELDAEFKERSHPEKRNAPPFSFFQQPEGLAPSARPALETFRPNEAATPCTTSGGDTSG